MRTHSGFILGDVNRGFFSIGGIASRPRGADSADVFYRLRGVVSALFFYSPPCRERISQPLTRSSMKVA